MIIVKTPFATYAIESAISYRMPFISGEVLPFNIVVVPEKRNAN